MGDALHGGAISSLIDTTGAMAAWTTAEIGNPEVLRLDRRHQRQLPLRRHRRGHLRRGPHPQARQRDHLLRRPRHQRRRQAPRPGHRRLPHHRARGIGRRSHDRLSYPLVEEPDTDELRELYERLSQTMPEIGVLNIFKALPTTRSSSAAGCAWHSPPRRRPTLSPRLREIAILRVAQVTGSEYEFAQHVRIAQQAGLTEDEIACLQNYDESEPFSDLDRAVIRYTEPAPTRRPRSPRARPRPQALALRSRASRAKLLRRPLGHARPRPRPARGPVDDALEASSREGWREWL